MLMRKDETYWLLALGAAMADQKWRHKIPHEFAPLALRELSHAVANGDKAAVESEITAFKNIGTEGTLLERIFKLIEGKTLEAKIDEHLRVAQLLGGRDPEGVQRKLKEISELITKMGTPNDGNPAPQGKSD